MTIATSPKSDTTVSNKSISPSPPSAAEENMKAALGGLAALIAGAVLFAVFVNPFLIAVGVTLLIAGCSHHLFWENRDPQLADIQKLEPSKINEIGRELGKP